MKDRTTATVWILLIFLVGVLFGGTTSYLMLRTSGAATLDVDSESRDLPRDQKRTHQRLYEQMADKLQLSAEQRSKIREMLEAQRKQYRAIAEEKIRKSRELRRETRSRFAEILTPAQMAEFNEFMRRHREKDHPASKDSHKDRKD